MLTVSDTGEVSGPMLIHSRSVGFQRVMLSSLDNIVCNLM